MTLSPSALYYRADAGKPCGSSHIPKEKKCSKPVRQTLSPENVAKVAAVAGLALGGAVVARRWSAGNELRFRQAKAAGITPDVYRKKTTGDKADPEVRELARARERACGRLPPERGDAFTPCPRTIGEPSAYGQILMHPDGERVFKVPMGKRGAAHYDSAKRAAANEIKHLELAAQAGISAPRPLGYNAKTGVIEMSMVKDAMTLRQFNNAQVSDYSRATVTRGILQEARSMHRIGLLHQDFHAGNLLVDNNNKVHIIDFGMAVSMKHHGKKTVVLRLHDDLRIMSKRAGQTLGLSEWEISNAFQSATQANDSFLSNNMTMLQASPEFFAMRIDRFYHNFSQELFAAKTIAMTNNVQPPAKLTTPPPISSFGSLGTPPVTAPTHRSATADVRQRVRQHMQIAGLKPQQIWLLPAKDKHWIAQNLGLSPLQFQRVLNLEYPKPKPVVFIKAHGRPKAPPQSR